MSARGYALHSVCPQLSFFRTDAVITWMYCRLAAPARRHHSRTQAAANFRRNYGFLPERVKYATNAAQSIITS